VYCGLLVDGVRKEISLHRFLMGACPGTLVDHKNGDTLDNRRSTNLRLCTNSQNVANSRPYAGKRTAELRGVYQQKNGLYRAQISYQNKKIALGEYANEELAAVAYDNAAYDLFGEFAKINFPKLLRQRNRAAKKIAEMLKDAA
jgi:hypothetical protein